jgi:UDP-N-acetylenolpyruvoylglucosamine reductase
MVEIEHNHPLARLTTVRTGGPAELFARAATLEDLLELIAFAARDGHQLHVIGSGSNLLVADAGVSGLVVRLEGSLGRIEAASGALECGGGARMPAIAARAAALALAGIEFAVNIPGTVGGAVRMNANAYGGALASVLDWVDVASVDGVTRRRPEQLGFGYRSSALGPGEVVTAARFALAPSTRAAVRATLGEMRAWRHTAQPKGIKTFGSTFKNPVVENIDGSASTADIVSLMALARERVLAHSGIALEREVQTFGEVLFPWELPADGG